MVKAKKIAVLMQGTSSEKDVSLETGKSVSKVLRGLNYNVSDIMVDDHIVSQLTEEKPDICFNALHGGDGENGNIQGLLNLLKIPYTHSGLVASAIGMNKIRTKTALQHLPIQFPKHIVLDKQKTDRLDLFFPSVLKPVDGGSSCDIYILKSEKDVPNHIWSSSFTYMLEDYIPGKELTVGVIDKEGQTTPLAVTELTTNETFFSYKAKYTENITKHILPARIPEKIYEQALEWAKLAHDEIGCRSVSRSDFRYDSSQEKLIMLEINTQPGLTALSLLPEQADYCGITFPDLLELMLSKATYDH